MGEFSLTAVDTLSSLAIMADSSDVDAVRFWNTVEEVARIYWFASPAVIIWRDCGLTGGRYNEPKECDELIEDCSRKTSSWGRFHNRSRESRGFDIDAKVQVPASYPSFLFF